MDMKKAIATEPAATPAEPAATPIPPRDTRLVDIGGGYHAQVWQVLAASDPRCKLCTGGLSKTTEADGKEHTRICGCGPLALRRRIEAMRKGAFVDNGDQFERLMRTAASQPPGHHEGRVPRHPAGSLPHAREP